MQHVLKVVLGGPGTTVRLRGTRLGERLELTKADVAHNQRSAWNALANYRFQPKLLRPAQ